MANSLYAKARERFLTGQINWLTQDIKCVLVDTDDYTVDLDTDEFLADIAIGARVSTSDNFTGKTASNGVADATDVVLSTVVGDESEAVVIYRDTGDASTSPLILYIDVAGGIPLSPVGGDVLVRWNDGSDRIFRL
jgi:hypothetical protein